MIKDGEDITRIGNDKLKKKNMLGFSRCAIREVAQYQTEHSRHPSSRK